MIVQNKFIDCFLKKSVVACFLSLLVISFSPLSIAADPVDISKSDAPLLASKVDVNTATAENLAENLKGIGLKKAEAIVQWREKNGNFTHIDQLLEVKGVGQKIIDLNKSKINI